MRYLPLLLLLLLAACADAPLTPEALPPADTGPQLSAEQTARIIAAYQEVEALYDLGVAGSSAAAVSDVAQRTAAAFDWRALDAPIVLQTTADTTTFTGVYDTTHAKGFLVQLRYRQTLGVDLWQTVVQHARPLDVDDGGTPVTIDAVETATLTFLTYADLAAFLTTLESGANAYLAGTSDDAATAFAAIDEWRVSLLYAPTAGQAVWSYASTDTRDAVTLRDPLLTLNANGTGTVRDGGPDGAVRTRYYQADFAVTAEGAFSGTLDRTLLSTGDRSDGAVISRTTWADGSYRETAQRGGNGVVIRTNAEG